MCSRLSTMGTETSVPILSDSEKGLSINTSAIDTILDQVGERPFVLYSINGPTRTGKSYMLNKFLLYLRAKKTSECNEHNWMDDFCDSSINWRGGRERHTIGINMWSKPFITKVQGREVAILLMDSQGSFDDQTSQHHNALIFTISYLFSSILIFNTMRDLREDMLQFFQLFSGFAKMVNEDNPQSDGKSMEKLIFLIRDMEYADYAFGYYDDNNCPSGQPINLKQHLLSSKEGQPSEVRKVREDISSAHQDIGLFALPHPGKQLARGDKEDNLDPEFKIYLKEFVELMLSGENLKTKHLGGIEVTGKEFKRIVHSWAHIFSGDKIPQINSVYETTAEMQNTIAAEKAINVYQNEMNVLISNNPTGISDSAFEATHKSAVERSINVFQQCRKIGGVEFEIRFISSLREDVTAKRENYFERNQRNRAAEEQRLAAAAEQARLAEENERRVRELQEAERKRAEEAAALQRQIDEANRAAELQQQELQRIQAAQQAEIARVAAMANQGRRRRRILGIRF